MKKNLLVIIAWLWLTMALLALFIRQVPPFQFIDSSSLILFIESSKLLFVLILFPFTLRTAEGLITSTSCHEDTKTPRTPCSERGNLGYLLNYLKPCIIFLLLFLPLTIMASHLGNAELGILLRSNLLILLIAAFIYLLSFRRVLIYYLAVFLLFGGGPILYYLILELAGASLKFLVLINPFWLFWNIGQSEVFNPAWLGQCLIWVALIIITLAVNRISTGKSLATKAPRHEE